MTQPLPQDQQDRAAQPMVAVRRGDAGAIHLTLNRPASGNALSAALVEALTAEIESAHADQTLHTLVLGAEGRNFCSGFDMTELAAETDASLLHRFVRIEQLLALLWRSPLRTVAQANGRAWGAGADLFACCDMRLAGAEASFRFPGAGFGIVLGTRRLQTRVGRDAALRLVAGGQQWDAATAVRAGLATALAAAPMDGPAAELERAPPVGRQTLMALREALESGAQADADLAALVRSASAPGLKARVQQYRDATKKPAAPASA